MRFITQVLIFLTLFLLLNYYMGYFNVGFNMDTASTKNIPNNTSETNISRDYLLVTYENSSNLSNLTNSDDFVELNRGIVSFDTGNISTNTTVLTANNTTWNESAIIFEGFEKAMQGFFSFFLPLTLLIIVISVIFSLLRIGIGSRDEERTSNESISQAIESERLRQLAQRRQQQQTPPAQPPEQPEEKKEEEKSRFEVVEV